MAKKYGTVIGIDPDVAKSGLACLDLESRALELRSLTFPEMLEAIREFYDKRPKPFIVVIEAGYLNKPHWHLQRFEKPSIAAAKGNSVGRNQQVAHDLVACLDYYGIPYTTIKPLVKMWNGPDRKITHEELVYFTGLKDKRSNQEERDAALLCWAYADFPFGRMPSAPKPSVPCAENHRRITYPKWVI